MAEAHYAQIAPHLYCGPIAAAAPNTDTIAVPAGRGYLSPEDHTESGNYL